MIAARDAEEIISIFNAKFRESHNTILARSPGDPVYVPAGAGEPHNRILFAHGFYASALHEIGHWCIAGAKRRELADFGYWYKPDGRNALEQKDFEAFEAKPQALEWIFSIAADMKFHVSFDNLNGGSSDAQAFRHKVLDEAKNYLTKRGLPSRAKTLLEQLLNQYKTHERFDRYWQSILSENILPD